MNHPSLGSACVAAMSITLVTVPAAAHAAAPAPTQITGFTLTTTADARLTVSGRLTATGATVPAGETLTIEDAKDDHTGWRTLPLPKGATPLKTQDGGAFSGTYGVGYPHGYYRIRFGGDTALAATVSNEIHDSRINAMVFGWKVTPRKIRKNGYVSFSGVLKEKPGASWRVFPGQRVYIFGRIKGESKWYWYARPKTDSKGRFKARFKVAKDTYWDYYYEGNGTHYYDLPLKAILVDVR